MEKKTKSWGVASLVTSILGLLLFLAPYIGLPLAIFAVVAANKQKKIEQDGMGQAGNVMGIIGIVINAIMLFIVLIVLMFTAAFSSVM